jgi:peptide/nickel transport system permease protein
MIESPILDGQGLNRATDSRLARWGAPRWLRQASLATGAIILLAVLFSSIFASYISPYPPNEQNLANTLQPPSAEHPFGTDNFGRDIFSRTLHAGKLDMMIGVLCVLFPWIVGVLLGCLAGYLGGALDTVIMRTVDVFTAFPFLVLAIAIIAILGPGMTSMVVALTLAGWTAYTRIVRGEILVVKKSEFIQAARALGYSSPRIMLRHVLPNVVTPAVIFAMADIILVILSTTALSFLGLGVQPPTPEWGSMIAEGRTFIMTAWWIVTFPGLAIMLVGLGFSLFGDGLADLLRTED